ncbi:C2 calcium-dependent domain-containing protein 4C-like [Carcharodon carcharias]|uniref:C2 calcium-dependent domain-containing protein 4C-like n=1 Tax=Carcharodon carcharias TaxID=13397 RepID=UPI001B7ED6BE|nr:C2 calcium-dependent domain-containing protein 4C-like [Carcharodon carcharias]
MWFLERVGRSLENLATPVDGAKRQQRGRGLRLLGHPNVLTPDRIPDFVIPPSSPSPGGLCLIQVESADPDLDLDPASQDGPGRVPLRANPAEIVRLPESPHTRRKESLFHARGPQWRLGLGPDGESEASSTSASSSSAESTPYSSPRAGRSPGWRGLSARPGVKGQALLALPGPAPTADDVLPSPGPSLSPARTVDDVLASRWPRPARESWVALDSGGGLRLWAEYAADGRRHPRVRVRLVSGHGLYPASFAPGAVSCRVALCLLPGEAQKQRSAVVKRSRSPVFNEDFFFQGLTREDLASRALKVKVVNTGWGVRRDRVMGESQLGLAAILPPVPTLNSG